MLPQQEGQKLIGTPGSGPNGSVGETGQPPHIPTYPRATRLEQTFPATHGRQQNRSRSSLHSNPGNGRETLAYASHRWSKTDEKKSPTDREYLAVLWAVAKFASYLQARSFTLIVDCSALTWLFKNQALSAKYHRWALRFMQYDMGLQWRPGIKYQSADALSRSHGHKTHGATVDDFFPGDSTTKRAYRGPQGPVLDGVPLGQLSIEGINNNNALPLTVLAAVTYTPDLPPVDTNPVGHRPRTNSFDSAPMLPKAVAIGCGEGG